MTTHKPRITVVGDVMLDHRAAFLVHNRSPQRKRLLGREHQADRFLLREGDRHRLGNSFFGSGFDH
jgi:hypothetical protein